MDAQPSVYIRPSMLTDSNLEMTGFRYAARVGLDAVDLRVRPIATYDPTAARTCSVGIAEDGCLSPRFSRNFLLSYAARYSPRRCSSGTTSSTKSSISRGSTGGIMLKPSAASFWNQFSSSSAI